MVSTSPSLGPFTIILSYEVLCASPLNFHHFVLVILASCRACTWSKNQPPQACQNTLQGITLQLKQDCLSIMCMRRKKHRKVIHTRPYDKKTF
jgi:hypothetical protein